MNDIVMRAPPTIVHVLARGGAIDRITSAWRTERTLVIETEGSKSNEIGKRTMPVSLNMEGLAPVRGLAVILPGNTEGLVLQ